MARLPSNKGPDKNTTSKRDVVIKLLQRKSGATLADMAKKTGWQPHTVRGFLSSTVRKKLGLSIETELLRDGKKRYFLRSGS